MALVCLVGLAVLIAKVATSGQLAASPACKVAAPDGAGAFTLDPDQTQNAAIIAAVGEHKGLPDHAVTVALAAALQESHLRDLPYGDRDSVGLFQQRPSQGWGSRTQLLDPSYATGAFYDALVKIPGWQAMAVTEAAQSVQHSAAASAYGVWEAEARSLAQALTGEIPAGLTCHIGHFAGTPPAPGTLGTAAADEFGRPALGVPLPSKLGWEVAAWAVAHASAYHVQNVAFDHRTWTAKTGSWSASVTTTGDPQAVVANPA